MLVAVMLKNELGGEYTIIPRRHTILIQWLAERAFGTLKQFMEKLADEAGSKWRENLGLAAMEYQLRPHATTASRH